LDMEELRSAIRDIPDFTVAIVLCWAGYLTGGVLMALAWLWEHKHVKNLSWKVCKIGVGGFLLTSFFWVWHETKQQLVTEKAKNVPDLTVDIYEAGLSPWYEDSSYVGAYFQGAVRDLGAQSVVDWKMELDVDGKSHQGLVTIFNTTFTLADTHGKC